MRTRKPERVGYRYIELDPDGVDRPDYWVLWVDGERVATAAATTTRPPFSLTEGLPFRPQYHSVVSFESGEPDSWVYRPPELRITRPRRPFWLLLAIAGVLLAAGAAYKPALIAAAVMLIAAAIVEVRQL